MISLHNKLLDNGAISVTREKLFWIVLMAIVVSGFVIFFVENQYVATKQVFGPIPLGKGSPLAEVSIRLECGSQDNSYMSELSDIYCKILAKTLTSSTISEADFSVIIRGTDNRTVVNCQSTVREINPWLSSEGYCLDQEGVKFFELPAGDYTVLITKFGVPGPEVGFVVTKATPPLFRAKFHIMSPYERQTRQKEDGASLATFLAFLFIIPTMMVELRSFLREKTEEQNAVYETGLNFSERVKTSADIIPWLKEQHGGSERTWAETMVTAPSVAYRLFEMSHKVWFECCNEVRDNSVTALMFSLVWDELDLAFKQAMEASYFSCIRCLRYVFEFAVKAPILEHKYSALPDGKEKFDKIFDDDDFKSFKRSMLGRLQSEVHLITEKENTELDAIYVKLSTSGAHAYGEFLKNLPALTTAWHKFNPELLSLCDGFCRDVVDLMVVVLMSRYPTLGRTLAKTVSELGLSRASSRIARAA